MKKFLVTTAVLTVTLTSFPALASTEEGMKALQAQMQQMMARIDALEKENKDLRTATTAPNNAVTSSLEKRVEALEVENDELRAAGIGQVASLSAPPPIISEHEALASIEPAAGDSDLTIGDTRIKFGGYAKADFITDVGSGYGADFVNFGSIPLDGSSAADRSSDFHAHARQSRLNVSSITPTSIGDVKAFAEIDFYGAAGSELVTNCIPSAQVGQLVPDC